jgi:hypothetical protein
VRSAATKIDRGGLDLHRLRLAGAGIIRARGQRYRRSRVEGDGGKVAERWFGDLDSDRVGA